MFAQATLVVLVSLFLVGGMADSADEIFFDSHEEGNCTYGVRLVWSADTGSAAFAPPLITDLLSDGSKEIVMPTFTHYVEALDGATGNDVHGWPFMHPKLRSQTSPVLLDLEHDGTPEIMVSTYTGELIFFRQNGSAVIGSTIVLNKALMRKQWRDFSKLENDKLDALDEKAYAEAIFQRAKIALRGSEKPAKVHEELKLNQTTQNATPPSPSPTPQATPLPSPQPQPQAHPTPSPPHQPVPGGRKLQQVDDMDAAAAAEDASLDGDSLHHEYPYDEDDYYGNHFDSAAESGDGHTKVLGTEGQLSEEAVASMDLIYHPELFAAAHREIYEADTIFSPRNDWLPVHAPTSEHIMVDAHVLATPVVVDLDFDGSFDVVVPVTYFFDAEYYALPENRALLPSDIDLDHYVMSALVAIDARSGKTKWTRVLGTTTKKSAFPAYALSSVTITNLDDDGTLDLVIVTSRGELMAFDAFGNVKRGFPVKVGPTHGQVAAEDVNGDGKIDLCVGDVRGTVSCFDRSGQLIFDRHVGGAVADSPVFGDVNADGFIDIVVATTTGKIWALDGRMGARVPGFPVQLGTEAKPVGIIGAPLLVNINNTEPPRTSESAAGLHLIVTALDGAMYIISGTTLCQERIDIGHHSYTMVLADDLLGNGKLHLLVTTLSGAVFAFETDATFSPLKAWPSQVLGINGFTARDHHLGIMISPESRTARHVRGESFQLMFEIVDERRARLHGFAPTNYFVAIHVGHQLLLYTHLFLAPGKHTVTIPVPFERKYATVFVSMRIPTGQIFEDSIALAFNMHFLDGIKYVVLIPFFAVMAALFFVHKRHAVPQGESMFDEDAHIQELLRARRRRVRHPGVLPAGF